MATSMTMNRFDALARHFSRLHIRILILVLITALPALAIISHAAMQQRREARDTTEQLALKIARGFAARQRQLLDESQRFLEWQAADPEFRAAAAKGLCGSTLRHAVQRSTSHYTDLFVADARGHILCSANPLPYGVNVADRSYFRRAMSRASLALGDFQVSRITGKQTVFLAYPMRIDGRGASGIVAAGLDLGWLQEMLGEAALPEGSVLTLVDGEGTILASYPSRHGQSGHKIPELVEFQRMISGASYGSLESIWLDGVPRLTMIAPLLSSGGYGIYLRIGIPSSTIFGKIDGDLWKNVGALVSSVLLVFALGLAASEHLLLRHLRDLTETARRLGTGDLGARPQEAPRHGELGQLARAFTEMAERLQVHERRIEYLVTRDSLTGLPNRALLVERVSQAIELAAQNRHCQALVVLDLDRFKFLNDSLGAASADALLQTMAERLRAFVPERATVAHLGADEFAVLLPSQAQTGNALAEASRLAEVFRPAFPVMERALHVTGSIGIALYPVDGSNGETLLAHARAAVHRVKQHGGNGLQAFNTEMKAEAVARLKLEQALRQALEQREFQLYFQPKVDIGSGRISGMEALLRWHSPELGMVSPAQFIPLAEETGLIIPIGEWVLRSACCQYRAWQQAGLTPPPVAVNVSSRQFWHGDLAATVARILQETGCAASGLELEVTESVVIRNIDDTAVALASLRRQGITISLDDFGTGYSSLSYLRRLPLDKLKIDRSFLCNLEHDPRAAMLIREIIAISHTLDLAVITEGVETAAELDILRQCGCDEAQGFYFSKPLPAEQLQLLLVRQLGTGLVPG